MNAFPKQIKKLYWKLGLIQEKDGYVSGQHATYTLMIWTKKLSFESVLTSRVDIARKHRHNHDSAEKIIQKTLNCLRISWLMTVIKRVLIYTISLKRHFVSLLSII